MAIDGLKIEVPSDELVTLLDGLVTKHTDKAHLYSKNVESLEGGGERVNERVSMDPIGDLKERCRQHTDNARYFAFLRDHIIAGETYVLTQGDLTTLEIMSARRW